jgi:hypothetical protein
VSDSGIAAVARLAQLQTLVLTGCHQVTTNALSDLCSRWVFVRPDSGRSIERLGVPQ